MKLVLSRKGFDSSFGGFPSPVLPDGTLLSLPIPDQRSNITHHDLRPRGLAVGQIVADLTGNRTCADALVHLDPDLEASTRARPPKWRPAFGQVGAAQRHLDAQGVGSGSVFLFFGWFREAEIFRGRLRYVPRAPHQHILFGWLRVEQILRVGPDAVPGWLEAHPHAVRDLWSYNTIYVAPPADGAGVFATFDQRLVLTEPGKSRSQWLLPADFFPSGRPPLTYHQETKRWNAYGDSCRLRSVAKGQEFVLDLTHYPGVAEWMNSLLQLAA